MMARQLHHLAERRSLAIHRAVADRLRNEPSLLEQARDLVGEWLRDGSVARPYAEAWQRWLGLPLDDFLARLTEDSEEARALRQVSPFAGFIAPRQRWAIWKAERERFEAENPEREAG